MKLTRTRLAAAAATVALGLGGAMPARADLQLRVTDSASSVSFTCMDQDSACDTALTGPNAIGTIALDSTFANSQLGGGAGFTIAGSSATVTNSPTQAQIDQSGNVTRTAAGAGNQTIRFDATFEGFNLFGRNPRTLSESASATFTDSNNATDRTTFQAFNDPGNRHFGGIAGEAGTFAAPLIVLDPGVGTCPNGNPTSCSANGTPLTGITERDSFSDTNSYTIQAGQNGANAASFQYGSSSLKNGLLQQVPEPTSMLLFGAGILGLGMTRRRKS